MTVALALCVLLLSLLAWIGQLLSAAAPRFAVRWQLTEGEADIDPAFHADVRAECVWDSLTLWTLAVAAILLLLSEPAWALFGLFGGGMYVYFAGRGIAQRFAMQRRGIRIGKPANVKLAYLLLSLWGLAGAATTVLASYQLCGAGSVLWK